MKKIGLLPRLIIGLVTGVIIGYISSNIGVRWPVRLLATFNDIFGQFLNYVIPLIIIGFIAPGIAELGKGAGKLLGITTGLAYISTVIAGTLAFIVGSFLLPAIVTGGTAANPAEAQLSGYLTVEIPPIIGVMTALITAFVLGLGMAALDSKHLYYVMNDFSKIVNKLISVIVIPLLPIHVGGIFANMTYGGQVVQTLAVFGQIFIIIIALHIIYLILQYTIAGSITGKNPLQALKNMIPAYVTAVGTQSSAATIPVTTKCGKKNGISNQVADFAIPLCATIHLSGSTITITMCSVAVMLMSGLTPTFNTIFPFILMIGITMIAAPGVPGGAVMAALGILQSMLGFNQAQLALMIALYLTQDSFGTACNVTGDGAIAMVVDRIANVNKKV
ncbi:dicarboxylate/amino acid:cation symporter [Garciella nitratireducens]|uniref:Na+/H+-dicarboxylate symporter n=1 Tax=Garciella nitratireducens DSM 15102 TaxID=1121911 RepID=A0A1T4KR84_9FIRM|nr:dicarboxylate/amino acid:cation symporter [Garciella nitratireducens]SJZ44916.1 Na+/H+-dicarboxylate symporter [Garciella nitratireducens DSM 15102]